MGVQIQGDTGNVIATKGTFSGDVGIAGTLTYEDVTNIDSVGLVTARTGIEIGARPGVAASISVDGNMIVSGISTFGGDVQVPDKIIHSGDTNTAIRFPAADTITAETGGSERARIDSAGDLGLGVTPDNFGSFRTLHIKGPSSEGAAIRLQDNGDTADSDDFVIYKNSAAAYLRVNGTDPLIAYMNGSERLRIDSSGRLLIGTTTEGFSGAQTLTIAESGHSGITIRSGDAYDGQISFSDATSGDGEYAGQIVYDHTDNFMMFRTNGGNERLRIDSAGNMGLGITPDTQGGKVNSLQIGSSTNLYNESSDDYTILGNNVYFDGTNNKYIKTQESSRLMQNAGEFTFQQAVSGSADANITYTTPFKIASSGRVFVNTTADPVGPSNVQMHVSRSGGNAIGTTIDTSGYTGYNFTGVTNGYAMWYYNTSTSANVGSITLNASSTSFNTSGSDRTLKKNFETWDEDILSIFKNINPQKFNFISQDDSVEKTKGFVAQDLVDYFPEAYPQDPNTKKYWFNPSGMVVYLMKAMQESQAKIETLETEVAALKSS